MGCNEKTCGMGSCKCTMSCGPNRSFFTKGEKAEMLQEYHDALQKEAQGVKEKIAELKKAS